MVGETISKDTQASNSSKWNILKDYEAEQKRMLDSQVKDLKYGASRRKWETSNDVRRRFEKEGIEKQPTLIRKLGRAVMMTTFGLPERERERMRRETMPAALDEWNKEKEEEKERFLAKKQRELEKEEEKQRALKELEAEKQRKLEEFKQQLKKEREQREREERKRIEQEEKEARYAMPSYMDDYRKNKEKHIRQERIQEIVERDLNSRLLTVDQMEEAVITDSEEIEKRSIVFEDTEIPVYDLKGLSYSMLSTTIDYRRVDVFDPDHIGTKTFQMVMDNPAIWAERRDEAEKYSGFGTRHDDARGDVISTSFVNSDRNKGSFARGDLIYGFEKVDADSIISIHNGDGGTSNMIGKYKTFLSDTDSIKKLEGSEGTDNYNEVLLRRYSENGISKKPDYIIVRNGKISDESLRHAKFFNIPIVNVEESFYEEKAKNEKMEILESISENDDYPMLEKKLLELLSIHDDSRFTAGIHLYNAIGRKDDMIHFRQDEGLGKMELLKRLDFIKKTLLEEIEKLEKHKEEETDGSGLSQFEIFNVKISDLDNEMLRSPDWDLPVSRLHEHLATNKLAVNFKLKGDSRIISTTVYDGKRINKNIDGIMDSDIDEADSSFYDELEPIVIKYFEAYRKNKQQEQQYE